MIRHLRKLSKTIHILLCLGMARTFGSYVHSGWNGEFNYSKYRWRGKQWVIPTGPASEDENYSFTKLRFGFKGKKQLPLFMVWREIWSRGKVEHAYVIFNSRDWIGR